MRFEASRKALIARGSLIEPAWRVSKPEIVLMLFLMLRRTHNACQRLAAARARRLAALTRFES